MISNNQISAGQLTVGRRGGAVVCALVPGASGRGTLCCVLRQDT